jgi:hypothetical protein
LSNLTFNVKNTGRSPGHSADAALLALLRLPSREGALGGEQLASASQNPEFAKQLMSRASYHGVLGVISEYVPGLLDLSDDDRQALTRRLALEELWHVHLMNGLTTAVSVLAKSGVQACALKGPVLAQRLYAPPAARYCMDVDLLVRPAELSVALGALAAAGYMHEVGVTAEYLMRYGHHLAVSRPETAPTELHFRAYAGFGTEVPADAVMARARPFDLGDGRSVLVMMPEDEFVYLAAHAAGHSFIRLVWLYDLKQLLAHHRALDWERVAAIAESFQLSTVVGYTIELLDRWLGVTVPNLPVRLRRRGVRARLADRLLTEVSTPQPKSVRDNIGGLIFTSMLCDRLRSGAWLVQHHAVRAIRRRIHRLAPNYLPEPWAG